MKNFSIITVNLNNSEGLKNTISSILSQNFKDFEYIIIDGDSTDGSKELIENNARYLSYWVSEQDKGIYDAMNKGIEHASGKYMMFLNSGDILLNNDVLKNSFEVINKDLEDIYYGNVIMDYPGKVYHQQYPASIDLNFFERRTINHQASFIKRTVFKETGNYNTNYQLAADYAFYIKAFIMGKHFKHIDDFLVRYDTNGFTSNNLDKYMAQMKVVWKETVPAYVEKLYRENNESRNFKNRVLVRAGKKLDDIYQFLKGLIKRAVH